MDGSQSRDSIPDRRIPVCHDAGHKNNVGVSAGRIPGDFLCPKSVSLISPVNTTILQTKRQREFSLTHVSTAVLTSADHRPAILPPGCIDQGNIVAGLNQCPCKV